MIYVNDYVVKTIHELHVQEVERKRFYLTIFKRQH
ncbi:hypothetical protein SAMN05880580_103299 [Priestia flexa]|jgi:hypothetical protein|nr:hypothetical protein SAMN05880580_103299 [Priestia flexa]